MLVMRGIPAWPASSPELARRKKKKLRKKARNESIERKKGLGDGRENRRLVRCSGGGGDCRRPGDSGRRPDGGENEDGPRDKNVDAADSRRSSRPARHLELRHRHAAGAAERAARKRSSDERRSG